MNFTFFSCFHFFAILALALGCSEFNFLHQCTSVGSPHHKAGNVVRADQWRQGDKSSSVSLLTSALALIKTLQTLQQTVPGEGTPTSGWGRMREICLSGRGAGYTS